VELAESFESRKNQTNLVRLFSSAENRHSNELWTHAKMKWEFLRVSENTTGSTIPSLYAD